MGATVSASQIGEVGFGDFRVCGDGPVRGGSRGIGMRARAHLRESSARQLLTLG